MPTTAFETRAVYAMQSTYYFRQKRNKTFISHLECGYFLVVSAVITAVLLENRLLLKRIRGKIQPVPPVRHNIWRAAWNACRKVVHVQMSDNRGLRTCSPRRAQPGPVPQANMLYRLDQQSVPTRSHPQANEWRMPLFLGIYPQPPQPARQVLAGVSHRCRPSRNDDTSPS